MSRLKKNWPTITVVTIALIALALFFPVRPLPTIEGGPKEIFTIDIGSFSFAVSNSMLLSWIVTVVLVILAFFSTRRMSLVPSGLQNLFEAIIEAINGLVSDIAGKRGRRFFPYVATIFFFVLFGNLLALIPGVGPIGFPETQMINGHPEQIIVPLLRSPSADLNNTVALAVVSVFMTQVFSIMALGWIGYGTRWFNFGKWGAAGMALVGLRPRNGVGKLLVWGLVDIFVGLVELFSELMKLVTFSFRLFGNIFAGEVILIVMAYLFAQLLPLPFYALEIFVGFIQAFVFAILTLVFMNMATQKHAAGESNAEL